MYAVVEAIEFGSADGSYVPADDGAARASAVAQTIAPTTSADLMADTPQCLPFTRVPFTPQDEGSDLRAAARSASSPFRVTRARSLEQGTLSLLVGFPHVDVDRFLRELPLELDDVSRYEALLDEVPGLAKPNNLALLNVAARCLGDGEAYLEVGTFRGTSLIAAMLGNDGEFVALDNWSMAEGSREELDSNLERHGLRARVLEGDAFETLRRGVPSPVGAYYYDNGHAYEQQLEGLRLVERYLASPALVIVDDTDWEKVERAVDDYLALEPRATEVFRADGEDRGHPEWWAGMRVLRWD